MVQGCSRAFLSTPATLWVFTIKYIYMSAKVSTAATGCPGNSLLCLPLTQPPATPKPTAFGVGTHNNTGRVAVNIKIPKKKKKKKANIAESAPLPGNEHDQIGPEALPSKRSQHLVD